MKIALVAISLAACSSDSGANERSQSAESQAIEVDGIRHSLATVTADLVRVRTPSDPFRDAAINALVATQCRIWRVVQVPTAEAFDARFANAESVFCNRASLLDGRQLEYKDGQWQCLKPCESHAGAPMSFGPSETTVNPRYDAPDADEALMRLLRLRESFADESIDPAIRRLTAARCGGEISIADLDAIPIDQLYDLTHLYEAATVTPCGGLLLKQTGQRCGSYFKNRRCWTF